jgi:molybdate transport system regulatory protein
MLAGPLKLKLQLLCGETFAIGPGKASLLEAIAEHGSISAAAKAIGMSYRRAWTLVDEMNRCFGVPLVETLRGGGRERGARITDAGRGALGAYRELEAEAARVAESAAFAHLTALLRDEPLKPD